MVDYDLVIRGPRVTAKPREVPRCVGVSDGVVLAIQPLEAELAGQETVGIAYDGVLLSGLIDRHGHVNKPGRTEWKGYETATRAAAAGGVDRLSHRGRPAHRGLCGSATQVQLRCRPDGRTTRRDGIRLTAGTSID